MRSSDVSAALSLGPRNVFRDEYALQVGRFTLPFEYLCREVRNDLLESVAAQCVKSGDSANAWTHALDYHNATCRRRTVSHSVRFMLAVHVLAQKARHQNEFLCNVIRMAYLNRHFPNGRLDKDRLFRQLEWMV